MKTSYTFDGRNLLTGIINTNPDGTNKKYYYNYDPEGLLTRKQEPKGTTTYRYNGDKQLVSMTEPSGRVTGYTYDRAGNRRSQRVADGSDVTAIEYIYDSRNRLTATVEKKPDTTILTMNTMPTVTRPGSWQRTVQRGPQKQTPMSMTS